LTLPNEKEGEIPRFARNDKINGSFDILFKLPTSTTTLGSNDGGYHIGIGIWLVRLALRNRSAFVITETELKLIAAAAIIGLSKSPKNG